MKVKLTRRVAGRNSSRGYTAVEVLMAMSVLTVGMLGIFSMEKVTVASNVHAKNLAIATHIGQGWLAMLEAESSLWDASVDSISRTSWLSAAPIVPDWFRPGYFSNFGPEFDELGNPVGDDGSFCVDLRISPFTGATEEAQGMGMRRAEVRVFWIRDHAMATSSLVPVATPCEIPPALVSQPAQARMLNLVHLSGAVRQGPVL